MNKVETLDAVYRDAKYSKRRARQIEREQSEVEEVEETYSWVAQLYKEKQENKDD